MTTRKVPNLALMEENIISSLKSNKLPTDKDLLHFFNLIKAWDEEKENSPERRTIFKKIFKLYKKRCPSKDLISKTNEMWRTINAIRTTWKIHKDFILRTKKTTPVSSFNLNSFSDYVTFLNH
jgi:hypothetical protein